MNVFQKRLRILKICLWVAVGVIAVRLFQVQILQHGEWVAKAEAQHTLENVIHAKRGEIYMMDDGEPTAVVMNETVYTIIVDPMLTNEEKAKEVVEKYAKEYITADWKDVFANKTLRYYIVAKNVPRTNAKEIEKELVAGMWFQSNNKRVYAEGEMASELLGFVNADGIGQYGVEGSLNKSLSGTDGLLKTVADVNNVALSIGDDNIRVPAVDGENVVLTVDRNIQIKVEQVMAEKLKNSTATNGSVLVMDPRNGKILAMANLPNYNPADYGNVKNADAYKNYVLEAYEPASVFKVFAFATAIDNGVMTPETTYVNTGTTTIDGFTIQNSDPNFRRGTITMQTALTYSLNTGSIQALRLLGGSSTEITKEGREKLFDYYYNHFGLGKFTGVELMESDGLISDPNEGWARDLTYANMTFGQGLNVTMLQVAAAFSSIVNGGDFYTPTIVAGKMVDGEFVKAEQKPAERKTVSSETSATMRQMLYEIRSSRRTRGIDRWGYYVGGKTGTGQVIIQREDGTWGYSDSLEEVVATYLGFGGANGDLPEYVIMVKMWGEGRYVDTQTECLPVFDSISNYLQDYLKIKPKGN